MIASGSDTLVRSPFFTGPDGEASDCDSDPTCAVTRDDGTVLPDADVDAVAGEVGMYTALLTADDHLTRPDRLTLTWSGIISMLDVTLTQIVDVAGGVYLTVPRMRGLNGLSDQTKYPAWKLRDACSAFESLAEDYLGRAFVPRYVSERRQGTANIYLLLTNTLLRDILSGSAVDSAGVESAFTVTHWIGDQYGRVTTDGDLFPWSAQANIIMRYTHGEDAPPANLQRAAEMWVRHELLADNSQVSRGAIATTDAFGTFTRMSTPNWGEDRPTGILDVDAILNAIGRQDGVA